MRIQILDGFRGFFLLFMVVAHINPITKTTLGKLNHHYFGWVEDAQGFVFISGLVVGLVYGGLLLKKSEASMARAVHSRMRTIYMHQAGLILIFLTAAFFIYSLNGDVPSYSFLAYYIEAPISGTITSLLLISGSAHMGILPMYLWFLLITPFVLRNIHNGNTAPMIMLSLTAWLVAQLGLTELLTQWGEQILEDVSQPTRLGIFFNILGWQILFFPGLYLGFKYAKGELSLTFLRAPQYQYAFFIGLAVFFGLGIFDRIVFDFWISNEFSFWFQNHVSRGNFSILYVLAFYLDLFLIVWLLVAGPQSGIPIIQNLAALTNWIFTRRFLVFLGQHSLHVFSFHVLLVYAVNVLAGGQTFSQLGGSLVLLASVASLYLPALWHAHEQRKSRKKMAST